MREVASEKESERAREKESERQRGKKRERRRECIPYWSVANSRTDRCTFKFIRISHASMRSAEIHRRGVAWREGW